MDSKLTKPQFPIILFFLLTFLFACSTPSWFPIKKGPPHKAKMKELLDKEVVIIDKQEYVKVLNPKVEVGNQPKYLYIPVDEYLTRREIYAIPPVRKEEVQISSPIFSKPSASTSEMEVLPESVSAASLTSLKRKVMIAHFDDRTDSAEEIFGDWLAERLAREVSQRSLQILFIDYPMVREFIERKGISPAEMETPGVLKMLNEVFGIHAVVIGELSGPYVFNAKATRAQDETSSAIVKIEMRVVDTFSGRILKSLSTQNPIIATKERGAFADEKAKGRAIDLALNELSRSLSRELDHLEWFCRVAKVEGDEVYINAGKLTGLKVGDIMEVFQVGPPGERREVKGRVRISAIFGIDASVGRMIQGKKPDENDILKPARREGS